jgi:hypothetical protein
VQSRFFANNVSYQSRKNDLLGRSLNVMTKRKALAITLSFIALGYAGAAVPYAYLIGLQADFPYLCPVCPDIFSLGSPLGKFIGRTIALGTVNAALFTAVEWSLIGMALGLKRFFSDPIDLHDE